MLNELIAVLVCSVAMDVQITISGLCRKTRTLSKASFQMYGHLFAVDKGYDNLLGKVKVTVSLKISAAIL